MRVLLINSNTKADLMAAPPIGLCYVADAAAEAGHKVKVLDLCFRRNISRELEYAVKDFSPEVIGVSIRNLDNANMLRPRSYVPDVLNVMQLVRSLSDAPIVVGGSGASLAPLRVLEVTGADYIIVSDGESAFVKLAECLKEGVSPVQVPGVGMIVDGRFHITSPRLVDFRTGRVDLGKWIDMRPYERMRSSYPVQAKRGCRHRCIYCTYNQVLEGNKLRLRDPEDVVDELEHALFTHRPQSFEFVDSVVNDPVDHFAQILEQIARRPWKATFNAMGVSPRGLDRELLDLMRKAGFTSFWITPESGSETMLINYNKGFTVDDLVRAAEALRGTKFAVAWTFLIGGPGETNSTLKETIDFNLTYITNRRRPPWFLAQYYLGVRIYPGTRLWEIAEAEGFVAEDSDPLEPLWYLSQDLDLDQAIKQLLDASRVSPEFVSGFDDKYLDFSGLWAFIERVARIPKLHWRLIYGANRVFRWPALRFAFKPDKIAAEIRSHMSMQEPRLAGSPISTHSAKREI